MRKLHLSLLLFSFVGHGALAQSGTEEKTQYKHYFGVNAGSTSGFGLSYKFYPRKTGFQITALPLIVDSEEKISVAFTTLFSLKQEDRGDFILFVSHHLTNFYRGVYTYNFGIGPGYEIKENSLNMTIMVGYALYGVPEYYHVLPTGSLSIFYRF